jgi:hypothetical protein
MPAKTNDRRGAMRRSPVSVPVGLEKVLYAAAVNPAFREALLRDREIAAEAAGLQLKPSELAMLRVAPESQLVAAIESLDISDSNVKRRGFMGKVAAAAVTIAAGACTPLPGDPDAAATDAAKVDTMTVDIPAAGGVRPDDGIDVDAAVRDVSPRDAGNLDVLVIDVPAAGGVRPDGGEGD